MENIRVHLIIEGRVQGVWFRDSTRREAISRNITGWVRNLPDGNVEVVAEGEKEMVEELVKWCHKGPPYASVTNVRRRDEEWRGEFDTFEIRF